MVSFSFVPCWHARILRRASRASCDGLGRLSSIVYLSTSLPLPASHSAVDVTAPTATELLPVANLCVRVTFVLRVCSSYRLQSILSNINNIDRRHTQKNGSANKQVLRKEKTLDKQQMHTSFSSLPARTDHIIPSSGTKLTPSLRLPSWKRTSPFGETCWEKSCKGKFFQ